ncbi:MAG: hypothetical protein KDN22_13675 [Verrucomicrobiae bacterium]|nr:hypothetical protein [Verrucomicrobiae bacterium]
MRCPRARFRSRDPQCAGGELGVVFFADGGDHLQRLVFEPVEIRVRRRCFLSLGEGYLDLLAFGDDARQGLAVGRQDCGHRLAGEREGKLAVGDSTLGLAAGSPTRVLALHGRVTVARNHQPHAIAGAVLIPHPAPGEGVGTRWLGLKLGGAARCLVANPMVGRYFLITVVIGTLQGEAVGGDVNDLEGLGFPNLRDVGGCLFPHG